MQRPTGIVQGSPDTLSQEDAGPTLLIVRDRVRDFHTTQQKPSFDMAFRVLGA